MMRATGQTFALAASAAKRHAEGHCGADILAVDTLARHCAIIDHYGVYATRRRIRRRAPAVELLRRPHVWMKLSAPYRVSVDALATRPDRRWLDAILACAEERCVWGSDWPHTPPHEEHSGPDVVGAYRLLSYERLVDDFVAALGSDAVVDRILRDNPARLYQF
jgi:predicted TIM-barrel fold metal-dependent hydrolase